MGKGRSRRGVEFKKPGDAPRAGREIIYGRQPVRELLRAERRVIYRILIAESTRDTEALDEINQLAAARDVPVVQCPRDALNAVAGDGNHQGIAAETGPYPYLDLRMLESVMQSATEPLLLVLDHLQDPQNVGSLLRSADAAGVAGIVLPSRRACPVTPAVVRASAGASEHMQIAQVPNIVQAMLRLKEHAGVWFAGLDCGPDTQPLYAVDVNGPFGLVVGSEGDGMRRLTRETCDFLVRLPMRGQIASLNAGVAGAVALYTVLQRREQGK